MSRATRTGAGRGRRITAWLLRTLLALALAPTLAAFAGSVVLVPFAGLGGLAAYPYALLGCAVLTVLWGLPCHVVLSLTGLRTLAAYLVAGAAAPLLFAAAAALDGTSFDPDVLLLLGWLLLLGTTCGGVGWYVAIGADSLD
jgi:predicted exporter